MRAGFIGLGAMGWPLAGHLHGKGQLAVVGNRSAEKAVLFASRHDGVLATSRAADFSRCDVVVLCVSADADVMSNVFALAETLPRGSVVVDHSTVAAGTAREAQAALAARGIGFLDAPVSGGVEGARNGKLSIMVGGSAADLAQARPVLENYALRITHMGGPGAGQSTKAVNQVLVAGIAQAVCEGLALGEKLGLAPELLVPTLAAGAAGNWFLDKRGATMLAGNYTPGFKSSLLHKDLRIVREMARAAGVRSTVIEQSLADYAELIQHGFGDEDTSALIRLTRGP
jgi:3-hydroxyisobutyrate dehydrogenase